MKFDPFSPKPLTVSLSALFLLTLSLATASAGTIVMDGHDTNGEWAGNTIAFVEDPQESDITATMNMKKVSVAQDADNLYLRIDTWSLPVDFTAGRSLLFFLDLDQDPATGCDDVVGHPDTGYELVFQIPSGGDVSIYTCSGGSYLFAGTGGTTAAAEILEVQLPLAAIGITTVSDIDSFVFFNNGTTEPDDIVDQFTTVEFFAEAEQANCLEDDRSDDGSDDRSADGRSDDGSDDRSADDRSDDGSDDHGCDVESDDGSDDRSADDRSDDGADDPSDDGSDDHGGKGKKKGH